jgi:hypothetical protein
MMLALKGLIKIRYIALIILLSKKYEIEIKDLLINKTFFVKDQMGGGNPPPPPFQAFFLVSFLGVLKLPQKPFDAFGSFEYFFWVSTI